jgi:hypothetical protein
VNERRPVHQDVLKPIDGGIVVDCIVVYGAAVVGLCFGCIAAVDTDVVDIAADCQSWGSAVVLAAAEFAAVYKAVAGVGVRGVPLQAFAEPLQDADVPAPVQVVAAGRRPEPTVWEVSFERKSQSGLVGATCLQQKCAGRFPHLNLYEPTIPVALPAPRTQCQVRRMFCVKSWPLFGCSSPTL